jgi:hypothetical protein
MVCAAAKWCDVIELISDHLLMHHLLKHIGCTMREAIAALSSEGLMSSPCAVHTT